MGINNRANRAKKKAARARARTARHRTAGSGRRDEDMPFPAPPDEALLDNTHCPVGTACQGCGATDDLRAVTSAFSAGTGHTVACTTLCADCDGRSFLHLFGPEGLNRVTVEHATHGASASPAH